MPRHNRPHQEAIWNRQSLALYWRKRSHIHSWLTEAALQPAGLVEGLLYTVVPVEFRVVKYVCPKSESCKQYAI